MSRLADETILELRHVSKRFRVGSDRELVARTFWAVRDVSLSIRAGETFGIVGESGCGKSTLARLIMGLEKPTSGEILFHGRRLDTLSEGKRRPERPLYQMVFQDSGSSLNPRKRVADILGEPMRYHHTVPRERTAERIRELLALTGLPEDAAERYPHEFSGGQRQRICIARALSLNPELLILDEPVSALDVSVQAQILNLLRSLQERLGLSCVFIGHGLGAVHYVSHRIAVMYMGSVVEYGESDELFDHPAHPYTKALLDASPVADDTLRDRERTMLRGEIGEAETGCVLRDRCPWAAEGCADIRPVPAELPGRPGHFSACAAALDK